MKIIEILKDFWFRLKWKGKFVIGIGLIACGDLKQFFEFFERRKKLWKKE